MGQVEQQQGHRAELFQGCLSTLQHERNNVCCGTAEQRCERTPCSRLAFRDVHPGVHCATHCQPRRITSAGMSELRSWHRSPSCTPDSVRLARLLTTAGVCSTCPMLTRCCGACRPPISGGCRVCPSGPSSAQSWSAFSLLDALRLMRREAAWELPKLLTPMFVAVMRCSKAPAPPADADTCSSTWESKGNGRVRQYTLNLERHTASRLQAATAAGEPTQQHAVLRMKRACPLQLCGDHGSKQQQDRCSCSKEEIAHSHTLAHCYSHASLCPPVQQPCWLRG